MSEAFTTDSGMTVDKDVTVTLTAREFGVLIDSIAYGVQYSTNIPDKLEDFIQLEAKIIDAIEGRTE